MNIYNNINNSLNWNHSSNTQNNKNDYYRLDFDLSQEIKLDDYTALQGYDAKKHLKFASDDVPEEFMADPGRLIPIIVNALQQLADQNDALTARVEELEKKLSS